jgi:hypothetical protein
MEDEQQEKAREEAAGPAALRAALAHLQRAQTLLQSPLPPPDMPLQVGDLLDAAIADLRQALGEAQGSPNTPPEV